MHRSNADSANRPDDCVIALDVGGTTITSALIDRTGQVVFRDLPRSRVNAQASATGILDTFAAVINAAFERARVQQRLVAGVGIAICGPFDYERGISLMQRDKFADLYAMDVGAGIAQRLASPQLLPIRFSHDVAAYLRGELSHDCYRGFHHIVCITLGTGVGTAFAIDGRIETRIDGVLDHCIGRLPYQDGLLLEDRIGRNGLLQRFRQLAPDCPEHWDVKEISEQALTDQRHVGRPVFAELGTILGNALIPIVTAVKADCLIVAGQIAGAFTLFQAALRETLQRAPSLRRIAPAQDPQWSPLRGAAQQVWDARSQHHHRESEAAY